MFTGIVENLGSVLEKKSEKKGLRLLIGSTLPAKIFKKGTSILVNGACLTVEKYDRRRRAFWVFLVPETLARTVFKSVKLGDKLNLESSLTLQKPLAGHLVLGHVDFVAKVSEPGPELELELPGAKLKYFPEKASITVHGVSLTIVRRKKTSIEVALIPETMRVTNLSALKKGDPVHIEIDVLARYLESLL
jgi:riboflavin synthase